MQHYKNSRVNSPSPEKYGKKGRGKGRGEGGNNRKMDSNGVKTTK
jgi:hypothetical protein